MPNIVATTVRKAQAISAEIVSDSIGILVTNC